MEEYNEQTMIAMIVNDGIAGNIFQAGHIVQGLKLSELPDDDARMMRARLYREWRRAGENRSAAFTRAIHGETAPQRLITDTVRE